MLYAHDDSCSITDWFSLNWAHVLFEGSYHHTPVDKSQDASYNLQNNNDDKTNDVLCACVCVCVEGRNVNSNDPIGSRVCTQATCKNQFRAVNSKKKPKCLQWPGGASIARWLPTRLALWWPRWRHRKWSTALLPSQTRCRLGRQSCSPPLAGISRRPGYLARWAGGGNHGEEPQINNTVCFRRKKHRS